MNKRLSAHAGVLLYLLTLPSCNNAIQSVMIDAPNKGKTITLDDQLQAISMKWHGIDRHDRVAVDKDSSIDVWMMEAKLQKGEQNRSPRGTLMIIHGLRNEKTRMAEIAARYANAGYRCFLVDLPGHGNSEGDYITYGVNESKNLVRVIDYLEKNKLIAGQFGVWGISMGASTAIQLAARDIRVRSVIAVAPYLSMRAVVPSLLKKVLPYTRWSMSDKAIQKMIDQAGSKAGFDPDEADTLKAIKKTDIPIMLIHGTWDAICPADHSRKLYAAAPNRVKLVEAKYLGHLIVHYHPVWSKNAGDLEWLDENLVK